VDGSALFTIQSRNITAKQPVRRVLLYERDLQEWHKIKYSQSTAGDVLWLRFFLGLLFNPIINEWPLQEGNDIWCKRVGVGEERES
jgi:hypothetical protein